MGEFEYKLWIHYKKKLFWAGSECTKVLFKGMNYFIRSVLKVAEWKRAIFCIQRSYFFSSETFMQCLLFKNLPNFCRLIATPLTFWSRYTHLPIPIINYWNIIIFLFILFYDNWITIKKIKNKKNQGAKMEYSRNKVINRSFPLWNKKDRAKKGSHPCH